MIFFHVYVAELLLDLLLVTVFLFAIVNCVCGENSLLSFLLENRNAIEIFMLIIIFSYLAKLNQ